LYGKNAKLRKGDTVPPSLPLQIGDAIISRKIEVLVQLLNDRSFKEVDFHALIV